MRMEEWSKEHGQLLQQIIEFNKYKVCVEIGVAYGTTTYYLCKGAEKNNGYVYGFDLWDVHGIQKQFNKISSLHDAENYLYNKNVSNFSLFKVDTKTEKFKEKINLLESIDFAFIDGCHSYSGIKNDFDIIYNRLSPYGMIAFHDTLRIDGCREFMIDLRTIYFDGTFDIIDFPWGNCKRRVGISLLVKRSYPICNIEIDEKCGSINEFNNIYNKEKEWYKKGKYNYLKNNSLEK